MEITGQLRIGLTPALGFLKGLSGALILLLLRLQHGGWKRLVGALMVLFPVAPKGLVLRELIEWLLVRRFLIVIRLVWNVRRSSLPHFVDILHYVVCFGIEQSNSVEGKSFDLSLGIIQDVGCPEPSMLSKCY